MGGLAGGQWGYVPNTQNDMEQLSMGSNGLFVGARYCVDDGIGPIV